MPMRCVDRLMSMKMKVIMKMKVFRVGYATDGIGSAGDKSWNEAKRRPRADELLCICSNVPVSVLPLIYSILYAQNRTERSASYLLSPASRLSLT